MAEKERLKFFLDVLKMFDNRCGVQASKQLSGINTAMYYGPEIMIAAHITIGNYNEKITGLILNIPLSAMNAFGFYSVVADT